MKGYLHTHPHSAHSVCFCFEAVTSTTSSTDYLLEFLGGCQGWFLIEFATKRHWQRPAQEARKLLRGAKKLKLFSNTSFKAKPEPRQSSLASMRLIVQRVFVIQSRFISDNVCPSHGPLVWAGYRVSTLNGPMVWASYHLILESTQTSHLIVIQLKTLNTNIFKIWNWKDLRAVFVLGCEHAFPIPARAKWKTSRGSLPR